MNGLRNAWAAVLVLFSTSVMADAVLDWNEVGAATVLAARQGPPDGARGLAMMHVAMFNAVNAIQGRNPAFGFDARAEGASANAAAAAAARTVLSELFPDQRDALL
jgi:hypothetical protein